MAKAEIEVKLESAFQWLIWSNEHNMWWRPEWMGYTSSIKNAGKYSFTEASEICMHGIATDANLPPSETMIPYIHPFVEQIRDGGDRI